MAFPTNGEAAELVQQGETLFHDVAQLAQTLHSGGLALRDDRFGATLATRLAEGVAVIAFVGQQHVEATPGTPGAAGDGWEAVEQIKCTADVGNVRAGGQHMDRGAVAVADQVVLTAGLTAVDRRRACTGTPFFASM